MGGLDWIHTTELLYQISCGFGKIFQKKNITIVIFVMPKKRETNGLEDKPEISTCTPLI